MLYTSPWETFEPTTSVVIGTDCIGNCKSKYHTITATTAPILKKKKKINIDRSWHVFYTMSLIHVWNSFNFHLQLLNLLKKDVEEYWPLREMGVSKDVIPYINILLLGPVGAGKSSFFNTLNSFFRERLSIQARAGSSDTSLTRSVSNQLKV